MSAARAPGWRRVVALPVLGTLLAAAALGWWGVAGDITPSPQPDPPATPAEIARGAQLARAGNCLACHTARGGVPYAGGRGIHTPWGTVYTGNLTPDPQTGLGGWRRDDLWRALHLGKSRDGRLLSPAFPYDHFTRLTRADSDALHAFLQSLPPVRQAPPAATLRWPWGTQAAVAVWRALSFRPAAFEPDPRQSAAWNRGAYLVQSLAHCGSCHSPRNAWGATDGTLRGNLLPMQDWYAPSLTDPREAGLASWPQADVVALLRTGQAPRGRVSGPMADVVQHGTQHLPEADLVAMATYLQALPGTAPAAALPHSPAPADAAPVATAKATLGATLYGQHCADCHGERGEGAPGAWPALAGNRAVTLPAATPNLVQAVLYGGYGPSTAGHPRPHGMPPFVLTLSDREVAAVLTHLRRSWGHQGPEVTELAVTRVRDTAAAP